jgi:adenine deaminase
MIKRFCKRTLAEVTRTLAAVAEGRQPADTVITNATLVNVCTAEFQRDIDIAISEGRIAYVGADASHCIGGDTQVIDADGCYVAPGFLDGHIHVESSMMGVADYARAVVPHGTTGIYMDPHEICNVLGLDGVRLMDEDARRVPLKTMITTPSCVPAVPGFEDTGAEPMTPDKISETMQWDSVVGLGEMMNFVGITSGDENAHGEVDETLRANLCVTGHYSIPETDRGLNAYVASGVSCCHESTRPEDVLAKMRLGMWAFLREGSAWHDLHQVAPVIASGTVDTRFACLVSDDNHPYTLYADGHVDHLVRRAIEEGIDPMTAIQMVTINCATCFKMNDDLGAIAPGKCADIVFFESLDDIDVTRVMIDGDVVAVDGKPLFDPAPFDYPDWATHSVHVKQTIGVESFRVAPEGLPSDATMATVRVMEVIPASVPDVERHMAIPAHDGTLESDVSQDVLKTFVFERHHETGKYGVGFTHGFGIHAGAMASTVAHDAHNLLVVGTNDADMALAANTLIESQGGMVVVRDGRVLGHVPLPIAGLMDSKPVEEMGEEVHQLEAAWKEIGCTMPSPFMTMGLIPLACLPDLRLTDRGLVDCNTFQFVDLLVEE